MSVSPFVFLRFPSILGLFFSTFFEEVIPSFQTNLRSCGVITDILKFETASIEFLTVDKLPFLKCTNLLLLTEEFGWLFV